MNNSIKNYILMRSGKELGHLIISLREMIESETLGSVRSDFDESDLEDIQDIYDNLFIVCFSQCAKANLVAFFEACLISVGAVLDARSNDRHLQKELDQIIQLDEV